MNTAWKLMLGIVEWNFLIFLNCFSDDKHCLLITFANSVDPDQDQQNVGPDLDPNCLTLMVIKILKEFLKKKNDCEKIQQAKKHHKKISQYTIQNFG